LPACYPLSPVRFTPAPEPRPVNVDRVLLLVAAGAAARWPVGRHPYCWFMTDQEEKMWSDSAAYRIPVDVARWHGDPAVAVAACAAVTRGRNWIEWRDIWTAQTLLLGLLGDVGVREYKELLSTDPSQVAQILRNLAEERKGRG